MLSLYSRQETNESGAQLPHKDRKKENVSKEKLPMLDLLMETIVCLALGAM